MDSEAGGDHTPEKVSLKPRKNTPHPESMLPTGSPSPSPKTPSRRGKSNTGKRTASSSDKKQNVSASDEPPAQTPDAAPKPPQATFSSTVEGSCPILSVFLDKLEELSLDIRGLRDQLQDQQRQLDGHDNQLMVLADQIEDQQSRLEAHEIQLQEQDVQLSDQERDIESLGGLVMRLDEA